MRTLPPALVLGSLLAATSCSPTQPPTFTPERASVTALTGDGIELRIQLMAQNPNRSDLAAQSFHVKVSSNDGRALGTSDVTRPMTLPAQKSTRVDVPFHVPWASATTLAALATQGRDVPYVVDGTIAFGGDVFHADVPFHMTGTVTQQEINKAIAGSLGGFKFPH